MEIIKNNLVSIILGVIALVALTTPMWLLSGYTSSLEEKAKASQASYTSVNGLLTKQRTQPGVDLQGQPKPLVRYPNQQTIDAGEALQKEVARTATDMTTLAVEINRQSMALPGVNQVLLVADSLPRPRLNEGFVFRDRYVELAEKDVLSKQILQGGMPPTKEEIDARKAELARQIEGQFRTFPGGGDNRAELTEKYNTTAAKLGDQLINSRADEIRIYVDPASFVWHPSLSKVSGQAPNPVEMWQAQLGLWIQTNFAKAIAEANGNARNVRDAVVKRLVRIEFTDNPYVLAGAAPGGAAGGEGGVPIPAAEADATGPLPKDFAKSITGRISNPLFDVVHFRALLHVDHARLPLLLQELSENRLMYVRGMHVTAIDPAAMQLLGFVYGANPTVEVRLDMEMLFMRAWTRELMPDPVRIVLGIPPRDPNAAVGAGGMGAGPR